MTVDPKAVAKAAVEWLDERALAMERKWGIDRLPRLVAPELAVRFRAQKRRFDEALASGRADAVRVQAEAMSRAWTALDRAAEAAGARPLSPFVWEARLPSSGAVVAIVRTAEEAHNIRRKYDGGVFTLDEVAHALDAFGKEALAVKRAFPGAAVAGIRPARERGGRQARRVDANAPLFDPGGAPPIDWDRGDEIPF